jgi:hypothetical protein
MIIGYYEIPEDFNLKRRIKNEIFCGSDSLIM